MRSRRCLSRWQSLRTFLLQEPPDVLTTNDTTARNARAEASRANGRLSRGPVSAEGKARSRCNGCKDGLTGAGIVLPDAAAAEVDRREAGFARDLRPRDAVERELVRQMALGAWRSQELTLRIARHDARMNAARFANWERDERLAAAELGHRLGDDPEAAVARLERSTAGCDWLIGRWTLLGNGLTSAEEGGPGCEWTDADLALALDLLGRPPGLRHLDDRARRLESLRAEARSGSAEAVADLRELVAGEVAELERTREEAWEGVEEPRLEGWCSGLELDLGPEGTRLRRYEAAADRLFRSAWTKLERLRKERGEPFMPRAERGAAAASVIPSRLDRLPSSIRSGATGSSPNPCYQAPVDHGFVPEPAAPKGQGLNQFGIKPSTAAVPGLPLLDDPSPVLDIWAAGPPRPGIGHAAPSRNKTNPAPGLARKAGPSGHRESSSRVTSV